MGRDSFVGRVNVCMPVCAHMNTHCSHEQGREHLQCSSERGHDDAHGDAHMSGAIHMRTDRSATHVAWWPVGHGPQVENP